MRARSSHPGTCALLCPRRCCGLSGLSRHLLSHGGGEAACHGDAGAAQYPHFPSPTQSEGPLGLYRGIGAGALTWAPYFGFYFWVYEALLSNLCSIAAGENPSFGVALGCGLAAGCSASALTNPFDVVKTRLMVGSTGIGARAAGGERWSEQRTHGGSSDPCNRGAIRLRAWHGPSHAAACPCIKSDDCFLLSSTVF